MPGGRAPGQAARVGSAEILAIAASARPTLEVDALLCREGNARVGAPC